MVPLIGLYVRNYLLLFLIVNGIRSDFTIETVLLIQAELSLHLNFRVRKFI